MKTAWWREPTGAQWAAFGAAWAGWVLDAFDFTIFLLVMKDITREFGVSLVAASSSITLTLIVRLLGGFVAGAMADRWGRKLPLMISILWFAACDGAIAFAPSFGWVLVLRTLFGFGMGAEWTSGTTLAMENWPRRSRGIASGLLQGSWCVGYLLAGVAAAFVLPRWGWRGMLICASLPALLVLPIRFGIKESKEWRDARDRAREAGLTKPRQSLVVALRKPWPLGKLAWAIAAMALGFVAYYSLTAQYPTMLTTELGVSPGRLAWLVALFNLGMLTGSVVCGVIAAKRGPVLAIAFPALASLAALPFYLGVVPGLVPLGAFLGGALGAGFCGVTPLLLTGMFEADVRARMVGIVYHVGALLAAFAPTAIPAVARIAGIHLASSIGIFIALSEVALAGVVIVGRRRFSNAPEVSAEEPTWASAEAA
jgi:SHS family lactate transporter-like MFS transporter